MVQDKHPPSPPGAITIREGALRIGLTEASLRNHLSRDPTALPATFVMGRRRFFVAVDVDRWVTDRADAAKAAITAHRPPKTRNSAEHRQALRNRALLSMHSASIIAGASADQLRCAGVPRTKVGRREYIAPESLRIFLESQRAGRA